MPVRLDPKLEVKGRVEGRVEGHVEGLAEALLDVLQARGIEVPQHVRESVLACQDYAQLKRWLGRVATVQSAEELLR